MKEEKNDFLLDVSEEHMSNTKYELLPLVGANFIESTHIRNNIKIVPQKDFRYFLKTQLHKSYYKINQIINVYLMIGAISDDGNGNYIINTVKTKFVGLTKATALYFLETLSELSLKVYCYLLNKYNIHVRYHYHEPFHFSKNQILKALGLSNRQTNVIKLNNVLFTLEELGLIEYNHKAHGIAGKHGVYMDLIKVNQYSSTQIRAAQEIADSEIITDAEALDRITIPKVKLKNDSALAEDGKVWLETGAYDWNSLPEKYKEAYLIKYGGEEDY